MALFKRGGVWWFQFFYRNKRFQESTRQGNKKVALDIQAARRTALAKGEVGIKPRKAVPRFDVAIKEFLAWSQENHMAHPQTHRRHIISSLPLLAYFKKAALDLITPEDVENYKRKRIVTISSKTKRLLKPATVNREMATLRLLFNQNIRNDVVFTNPVRKVKFLEEHNEQTRVVGFEEQEKYLVECSQPLRDVAALMLETGMRPEELYRLRVDNVNLKAGWLFNPSGKTKAAKRKVPLTRSASTILQKRLSKAKGPYVFGSESDPDQPITKLNKPHCTAVKRSKVARFRLYDLRHTFATRAIEAGVDLITLAALLGHSRIVMVQRYAHPGEEHKADAMRKLEGFCDRNQSEAKATEPNCTLTVEDVSLADAVSPSSQ
jgi:integrase